MIALVQVAPFNDHSSLTDARTKIKHCFGRREMLIVLVVRLNSFPPTKFDYLLLLAGNSFSVVGVDNGYDFKVRLALLSKKDSNERQIPSASTIGAQRK